MAALHFVGHLQVDEELKYIHLHSARQKQKLIIAWLEAEVRRLISTTLAMF